MIYRPETERESHYFQAVLPEQFDEYIWFDGTSAVTPLATGELQGLPDTYPFGLLQARAAGRQTRHSFHSSAEQSCGAWQGGASARELAGSGQVASCRLFAHEPPRRRHSE